MYFYKLVTENSSTKYEESKLQISFQRKLFVRYSDVCGIAIRIQLYTRMLRIWSSKRPPFILDGEPSKL